MGRLVWAAKKPTASESSSGPPPLDSAEQDNHRNSSEHNSGEVLRLMIQSSLHDPAEFRVIIEVLVHRIRWTEEELKFNGCYSHSDIAESVCVADSDKGAEGSLSSRLSGGAYVWVLSPAVDANANSGLSRTKVEDDTRHPVELQSPPLSLIHWHSAVLGEYISDLQSHWISLGLQPVKSTVLKYDSIPSDMRLLNGEYDIWQEVCFLYMLLMTFNV